MLYIYYPVIRSFQELITILVLYSPCYCSAIIDRTQFCNFTRIVKKYGRTAGSPLTQYDVWCVAFYRGYLVTVIFGLIMANMQTEICSY